MTDLEPAGRREPGPRNRDEEDLALWIGSFFIILALSAVVSLLRAILDAPELVGQFVMGAMMGAVFTLRHDSLQRFGRLGSIAVNSVAFGVILAVSGWGFDQLF